MSLAAAKQIQNEDLLSANVRELSYDRYLFSLFAPEAQREELHIIYAFDNEISNIKNTVTEEMPGLIKIQWWRDEIDKIYLGQTTQDYYILSKLGKLIEKYKLEKKLFDNYLANKEKEIQLTPFATLNDLLSHIKHTDGTILAIQTCLLSNNGEININNKIKQALLDINTAQSIINILRNFCLDIQKQRILFPQEIIERHNTKTENIINLSEFDEISAISLELADIARSLLAQATNKKIIAKANKAIIPLLLPAVATNHYIKKINKKNGDIINHNFPMTPLLQAKLYLTATKLIKVSANLLKNNHNPVTSAE